MSPDGERGSTARPALQLLREVWSGGDLALIDELVTDDYVHSDSVLPDLLEGPAALREWVETVRAGTPDMTKTVRETYVDDDAVIVAYTATGAHEGDIFGIAPTGRSLEVDGVCVSRVANGRFHESTDPGTDVRSCEGCERVGRTGAGDIPGHHDHLDERLGVV